MDLGEAPAGSAHVEAGGDDGGNPGEQATETGPPTQDEAKPATPKAPGLSLENVASASSAVSAEPDRAVRGSGDAGGAGGGQPLSGAQKTELAEGEQAETKESGRGAVAASSNAEGHGQPPAKRTTPQRGAGDLQSSVSSSAGGITTTHKDVPSRARPTSVAS